MALGIITGREITKNKDGDVDRVLLQVKMIEDPENDANSDVRTVELVPGFGVDINPADDCRVLVVEASKGYKITGPITDNLEPETDPGEKEIYSTDNPVTEKRAKITLNADGDILIDAYGGSTLKILQDGNIEINGNADYAVAFNDLKTEFNKLKDDYNAHTHNYNPGPGAATPTTVTSAINTSNIDNAKVDEVKLP